MKAAAVAGGRSAPWGRRRDPAWRVFTSAKCLQQKLRRLLGTRLPGPSCPFLITQKSARSPDNVPPPLPTGPIPLRLPRTSRAAWGAQPKQPRPPQVCQLLPPSPSPVCTSVSRLNFISPLAGLGQKDAALSPTEEEDEPATPKRRRLGRGCGGSAPPAPPARPPRSAPGCPRPRRRPLAPPRLPGPRGQRADSGQSNGGQRRGEGRGAGGGGRWQVPGPVPPGFASLGRRSATPGACRSAEEIAVRSITCQTLNWIGYFYPLCY